MSQDISMSMKRHLIMQECNLNINEFKKRLVYDKNKLFFENNRVYNFNGKNVLKIDILTIEEDCILLEGRTDLSYFIEDCKVFVEDELTGNNIKVDFCENKAFNQYTEDNEIIFHGWKFSIRLPLENGKYTFVLYDRFSKTNRELKPSYGRFAKLTDDFRQNYFYDKGYKINLSGKKFLVTKIDKKTRIRTELSMYKKLLKSNLDHKYQIVFMRVLYQILRCMIKKDIWLISDRAYVAGDNGEAFFKYAVKQKEIKAYFLIDQSSEDYNRLKTIGKVVKYNSFKHKLIFLLCKKLISASADGWVFNIMGDEEVYFKDLFKFDYVFLQHGIIQKDFSKWLNKLNKNISLFVTSAIDEYNSILNGDYGYMDKEVKLTGLPRFDYLKDDAENIISIMPTWRKYIAADHVPLAKDSIIKVRGYSDSFKETSYYKFYQGLISNEKLVELLNEYNYKIELYMHPSFAKQSKDFRSISDRIVINEDEINYNSIFKKSALLITDYSSVAMDFAYLKKPIIYTQFDKEEFLNNHTGKEGYFDYEEKGFGPVCITIEETVEQIENYLKNSFKMDEKYISRVDEFFAYTDRNNCERVYKEIKR